MRTGFGAESGRVTFALVHHANQYLITEGYADREGLGEILGVKGPSEFSARKRGLLPLLQMHVAYGVPLNLHLSGTLIETLAWHYPESLSLIRQLLRSGLIEIIGSTLSQNVMPFFSDEYNRRQINEALWLYRRHLGCDLRRVKTFWVPERVWHTEKLAPILTNPRLLNGGYRQVLLDDRLVHRVGADYSGSSREAFDRDRPFDARALSAWNIAGVPDLTILPISLRLRYLIPPAASAKEHALSNMLRALRSAGGDRSIAIYGDDLERAAGVGCWDARHAPQYERFLRWLSLNRWVEPVLLSEWVRRSQPLETGTIDPGTFFELARTWGAGEDYRGWHDDPNCQVHRRYLAAAEQALASAEPGVAANAELLELGWRHLFHCAYETSWHNLKDARLEQPLRLAPWAAALTSHARSCAVIVAAADWAAKRDGLAHAELTDLDGDGELELVVKNDRLFAVLSPRWGGRLTYLFDLTNHAARLVVGNISDDWNLQEELNRSMDCPRNHPGGLADVGQEHDRYVPELSIATGQCVRVSLHNVEPGSPLAHLEKRLTLMAGDGHLCVAYVLPEGVWRASVDACLSPDYYRMLREGRVGLAPIVGRFSRGWRNGSTQVWIRLDRDQSAIWNRPDQPECGHGLMLRLTIFDEVGHFDVGVGEQPRGRCAGARLAARERRARRLALRSTLETPAALAIAGGTRG